MTKDMERQLQGYGLTTAQIIYRLPDHQAILQTYIWQDYDLAPDFPEMRGFLKFWQEKLDGPLHSGALHPPQADLGDRMARAERRIHPALTAQWPVRHEPPLDELAFVHLAVQCAVDNADDRPSRDEREHG